MDVELPTLLYRFGVALAIGALVGFERQFRLEQKPESDDEDLEPDPDSTEEQIRAAVAASESTRYPPIPEPEPAPDPDHEPAPRRWIPDFNQAIGVRTLMLLALVGAMAASVPSGIPWVFAAVFLVVGGLIAASYAGATRTSGDVGLTSEISALGVFLLGGLCAQGMVELASAVGVVMTITLARKRRMHGWAKRIRPEDIDSVLKFAVLTLIVLPVLPSEPLSVGELFPPPDVAAVSSAAPADTAPVGTETLTEAPSDDPPWWRELSVSPRKIWFMVILISAISFAGYILDKLLGTGRGLIVTALVGGLVSSTAVSLSYAQKSKEAPGLSRKLAIGILLANAIMPLRLLLVVGIIAPVLWAPLAAPLLAMTTVAIVTSLGLHLRSRTESAAAEVDLKNPFEIGPAIKFGLLFGAVLLGAQVAQVLLGNTGLYLMAVVTGLTDVDAIGLASANLVSDGELLAATAAVTVALAALSNTVVKGGFVATMGSQQLRRITLAAFALMVLAASGGIAWIQFAL